MQTMKKQKIFSENIDHNHGVSYNFDNNGRVGILTYDDSFFFGTPYAVKEFYHQSYTEAKVEYTKKYQHSNKYRDFIHYINECDTDTAQYIIKCSNVLLLSSIKNNPDDNSILLVKDCFKAELYKRLSSNFYGNLFTSMEDAKKNKLCEALSQTDEERYVNGYNAKRNLIDSRYDYFISEVNNIFNRCNEMQNKHKEKAEKLEQHTDELSLYEKKKNIDVQAKERILEMERKFMEVTQKIAQEQDLELRKLQQDQADFYLKQIKQMKELLDS